MITLDPNWWGLGILGVILIVYLIASRATYKLDRERDAAFRELDVVHRRYCSGKQTGQTDAEQ